MGSQYEHIERIRTETFGLRAHDASKSAKPAEKPAKKTSAVAEILGRAVSLLADNLYSKDVHFILEIIQNAEDNDYDPKAVPSLKFLLASKDPTNPRNSEGALFILNNEIGFRPEHTAAICNIAKSTKTNKSRGYIGEKGIGFKSVFLVSANPFISSAGYRFSFHERPDKEAGFGYIVPTWDSDDHARKHEQAKKYQTAIMLPLKAGKRQIVANQLRSLAPETILFLTKLKKIEVEIEASLGIKAHKSTCTISRQDVPEGSGGVVKLHVNDEPFEFWMVTERHVVPDIVMCDARQGVAERYVSVALTKSLNSQAMQGQAFSFLPTLERTGLPVMVNADFILNVARESIITDIPWNIWLREALVHTYYRAVHTYFMDHLKLGYRFIPLDRGDNNFFTPVIQKVQNLLQTSRIIRCRGTYQKPENSWCLPTEVFIPHPDFYDLIPLDDPQSSRAALLVVKRLIEKSKAYIMAIGVRELSAHQYLAWLSDERWLENRIKKSDKKSRWVERLLGFLSAGHPTLPTGPDLQNIRMLPLMNGDISRASEGVMLYNESAAATFRTLPAIVRERTSLRVFDKTLYDSCDYRVQNWLRSHEGLHLRSISVLSLCLQEVAKLHNENNIAPPNVSAFVALTSVMCDRFQTCTPEERARILSEWPLLFDTYQRNSVLHRVEKIAVVRQSASAASSTSVVLPENHDLKGGWQLLFARDNRFHLRVLSASYVSQLPDPVTGKTPSRTMHPGARFNSVLAQRGAQNDEKGNASSGLPASMLSFFKSALKITPFPLPLKRRWDWKPFSFNRKMSKEAMFNLPWDIPMFARAHILAGSIVWKKNRMKLEDVAGFDMPTNAAEPLPLIADPQSRHMCFARAMFAWLEAHVNQLISIFSQNNQAEFSFDKPYVSLQHASDLYHRFHNYCWVPTVGGRLICARDVLMDTPEIRTALGASASNILHRSFSCSPMVASFLGFGTTVGAKQALDQLRLLTRPLSVDVPSVLELYLRLETLARGSRSELAVIRAAFQKEKLIYFRRKTGDTGVAKDTHPWLTSNQVIWSEKARKLCFDGCRGPMCLEEVYETKYFRFFTRVLDVRVNCDPLWYAKRWYAVKKTTLEHDIEARQAVFEMFYDWFESLAPRWDTLSSQFLQWFNDHLPVFYFLTSTGTLARSVYIDDDPEISRILKEHARRVAKEKTMNAQSKKDKKDLKKAILRQKEAELEQRRALRAKKKAKKMHYAGTLHMSVVPDYVTHRYGSSSNREMSPSPSPSLKRGHKSRSVSPPSGSSRRSSNGSKSSLKHSSDSRKSNSGSSSHRSSSKKSHRSSESGRRHSHSDDVHGGSSSRASDRDRMRDRDREKDRAIKEKSISLERTRRDRSDRSRTPPPPEDDRSLTPRAARSDRARSASIASSVASDTYDTSHPPPKSAGYAIAPAKRKRAFHELATSVSPSPSPARPRREPSKRRKPKPPSARTKVTARSGGSGGGKDSRATATSARRSSATSGGSSATSHAGGGGFSVPTPKNASTSSAGMSASEAKKAQELKKAEDAVFPIMWFPVSKSAADYPFLLEKFASKVLSLSKKTQVSFNVSRLLEPSSYTVSDDPLASKSVKYALLCFLKAHLPFEEYEVAKTSGQLYRFLCVKEVFVESIDVTYQIANKLICLPSTFFWEEKSLPRLTEASLKARERSSSTPRGGGGGRGRERKGAASNGGRRRSRDRSKDSYFAAHSPSRSPSTSKVPHRSLPPSSPSSKDAGRPSSSSKDAANSRSSSSKDAAQSRSSSSSPKDRSSSKRSFSHDAKLSRSESKSSKSTSRDRSRTSSTPKTSDKAHSSKSKDRGNTPIHKSSATSKDDSSRTRSSSKSKSDAKSSSSSGESKRERDRSRSSKSKSKTKSSSEKISETDSKKSAKESDKSKHSDHRSGSRSSKRTSSSTSTSSKHSTKPSSSSSTHSSKRSSSSSSHSSSKRSSDPKTTKSASKSGGDHSSRSSSKSSRSEGASKSSSSSSMDKESKSSTKSSTKSSSKSKSSSSRDKESKLSSKSSSSKSKSKSGGDSLKVKSSKQEDTVKPTGDREEGEIESGEIIEATDSPKKDAKTKTSKSGKVSLTPRSSEYVAKTAKAEAKVDDSGESTADATEAVDKHSKATADAATSVTDSKILRSQGKKTKIVLEIDDDESPQSNSVAANDDATDTSDKMADDITMVGDAAVGDAPKEGTDGKPPQAVDAAVADADVAMTDDATLASDAKGDAADVEAAAGETTGSDKIQSDVSASPTNGSKASPVVSSAMSDTASTGAASAIPGLRPVEALQESLSAKAAGKTEQSEVEKHVAEAKASDAKATEEVEDGVVPMRDEDEDDEETTELVRTELADVSHMSLGPQFRSVLWRVVNLDEDQGDQRVYDFTMSIAGKLAPHLRLVDKLQLLLTQALQSESILHYALRSHSWSIAPQDERFMEQCQWVPGLMPEESMYSGAATGTYHEYEQPAAGSGSGGGYLAAMSASTSLFAKGPSHRDRGRERERERERRERDREWERERRSSSRRYSTTRDRDRHERGSLQQIYYTDGGDRDRRLSRSTRGRGRSLDRPTESQRRETTMQERERILKRLKVRDATSLKTFLGRVLKGTQRSRSRAADIRPAPALNALDLQTTVPSSGDASAAIWNASSGSGATFDDLITNYNTSKNRQAYDRAQHYQSYQYQHQQQQGGYGYSQYYQGYDGEYYYDTFGGGATYPSASNYDKGSRSHLPGIDRSYRYEDDYPGYGYPEFRYQQPQSAHSKRTAFADSYNSRLYLGRNKRARGGSLDRGGAVAAGLSKRRRVGTAAEQRLRETNYDTYRDIHLAHWKRHPVVLDKEHLLSVESDAHPAEMPLTAAGLRNGSLAYGGEFNVTAAHYIYGKGCNILQMMGWKAGDSIGLPERHGLRAPLVPAVKIDRRGLISDFEVTTKRTRQRDTPEFVAEPVPSHPRTRFLNQFRPPPGDGMSGELAPDERHRPPFDYHGPMPPRGPFQRVQFERPSAALAPPSSLTAHILPNSRPSAASQSFDLDEHEDVDMRSDARPAKAGTLEAFRRAQAQSEAERKERFHGGGGGSGAERKKPTDAERGSESAKRKRGKEEVEEGEIMAEEEDDAKKKRRRTEQNSSRSRSSRNERRSRERGKDSKNTKRSDGGHRDAVFDAPGVELAPGVKRSDFVWPGLSKKFKAREVEVPGAPAASSSSSGKPREDSLHAALRESLYALSRLSAQAQGSSTSGVGDSSSGSQRPRGHHSGRYSNFPPGSEDRLNAGGDASISSTSAGNQFSLWRHKDRFDGGGPSSSDAAAAAPFASSSRRGLAANESAPSTERSVPSGPLSSMPSRWPHVHPLREEFEYVADLLKLPRTSPPDKDDDAADESVGEHDAKRRAERDTASFLSAQDLRAMLPEGRAPHADVRTPRGEGCAPQPDGRAPQSEPKDSEDAQRANAARFLQDILSSAFGSSGPSDTADSAHTADRGHEASRLADTGNVNGAVSGAAGASTKADGSGAAPPASNDCNAASKAISNVFAPSSVTSTSSAALRSNTNNDADTEMVDSNESTSSPKTTEPLDSPRSSGSPPEQAFSRSSTSSGSSDAELHAQIERLKRQLLEEKRANAELRTRMRVFESMSRSRSRSVSQR